MIGIAIAMLVLLPETWAAVRAARANRLQTSLNLAHRLGRSRASASPFPWSRSPRSASTSRSCSGLEPKDLVMLALTFVVGAITLGTGRTNVMQGAVHLVIFAAFLFLALVP